MRDFSTILRCFPIAVIISVLMSQVFAGGESESWSVDSVFSENHVGVNGRVYCIAEDSQRRFFLGGYFSTAAGQNSQGIARFTPSGELDDSFDPGDGVDGGVFGYVSDCIVLEDDSVILVGDFQGYDGYPRSGIVRVLEDGSIDPTFANDAFIPGATKTVRCIEALPSGEYIIGGDFNGYSGNGAERMALIDEDGSFLSSFDTEGAFYSNSDFVDEIRVLENGDYIVAGRFSEYKGHTTLNIARVHSDGSVDTSFSASVTDVQYLEALEIAENGDILVGGTNNGPKLFRLDSTGDSVNGFQPELNGNYDGGIYDILELAEGLILVVGYFDDYSQPIYENCVILNADGSLDQSLLAEGFNPLGGSSADGSIITIDVSASGKLYLDGDFVEIDGVETNRVARINASGLNAGGIEFAYDESVLQEGRSGDLEVLINVTIDQPVELEFEIISSNPEILENAWVAESEYVYPDDSRLFVPVDYDNDNDRINSEEISFQVKMTQSDLGISDLITIIIEDDEVPGTVFFKKSSYILNEEDGSISLEIGRYLNDPGALDVRVQTEDITALSGVDYVSHNSVHTFAEGEYSLNVEIEAFENTPEPKPLKNFAARLNAPTPSTKIGSASLAYIIVNDKDDSGSVLKAPVFPNATGSVSVVDMEIGYNGVIYGIVEYRHPTLPSARDSKLFRINADDDIEVLADLPSPSVYLGFNDLEIGRDGSLYVAGRDILRYSTDGVRDLDFIDAISGFNEVRRIFSLPDGKFLVAGRIQESIGGYNRLQVARLFADGSVDPSVDIGVIGPLNGASWMRDVIREPSGKLLLVGDFSSIQGEIRYGIARIWPDGTLDPSFDSRVAQANKFAYRSYGAVIDADGIIYLGTDRGVIKLNASGSAVDGFNVFVGVPLVQPDGKLLAGGSKRYYGNGLQDSSLDVPSGSGSTLIGTDGRLYTYGFFSRFDGKDANGLVIQRGDSGTVPARFSWQLPSISFGEGIGLGSALIERSGNTVYQTSVFYSTQSESANVLDDVIFAAGYRQFGANEVEALADFQVVDDDLEETNEVFSLQLYDPSRSAVLLGSPDLPITIVDNDGDGVEAWLSRYYPQAPLNSSKLSEDTDKDGDLGIVEWLNGTDPLFSSSIRRPFSGQHVISTPEGIKDYFGLSFYINTNQETYKYLVEFRPNLDESSWETIWDSSGHLAFEAEGVVAKPETGSGWITIRGAEPMGSQGYLRLRYEEIR